MADASETPVRPPGPSASAVPGSAGSEQSGSSSSGARSVAAPDARLDSAASAPVAGTPEDRSGASAAVSGDAATDVPLGSAVAGSSPGSPAPAPGPPPRLAQGREHIVATVDEIPPGSSKVVPIGRHGVGVYNVNGTFYAIANYCPHEGGPLCAGRARGRTVVDESVPGDSVMVRDNEFIYCPWHQWGFELATGTTAVKPEWSIRTYPVRVVGDDVLVTA